MHPSTQTTPRARLAWLATALASLTASASAQPTPAANPPGPPALQALFNAAWARQPEAQALAARRDAVQSQRQAAAAWTPEPPALEVRHKSDRLLRNDGARELEIGVAVPLWLPGERGSARDLADAEATSLESRAEAARLRLAATVREAWWNWQRARADVASASARLDSARQLAADVARRTRAGDLARADHYQAEGTVAAAEAELAQAEAATTLALQQVQALGGPMPTEPPAGVVLAEPEPAPNDTPAHPAMAELQDRLAVAERTATLAAAQWGSNPELALTTTRERGNAGERYGQTVTLALRIPFGAGPRQDARAATARAEAAEAQAQLALDRTRLQSAREAAVARVAAARTQLAAAERRATWARETRGFFDKSFRLGESDLPTRLRIEAEATDAERQAARGRIELAAAISAWRQALGLLPQ